MGDHHPLEILLNIHLASDTSAALHLPFILTTITPDSLGPSAHLSKWAARVQALLHSKEPGGRWAGLVLARKTADLDKTLLLENGQSWVGVALPMLSKNEPVVVLKAAIRFLRTILCRSHALAEFRRQVATANIPKLLAALIPLARNNSDAELKVVAMSTLVNIIPLYPTLHKPSYSALSDLALHFLDGAPHTPVPYEVLSAASRLYSTIHLTGGKVGALSFWRKSLDETLVFGRNAFWSLRSTFNVSAPPDVSVVLNRDPVTSVPLHLDRLRCVVTILDDLLGATVHRPVQIPLGSLVQFALHLLRTTANNKPDSFVDKTTHMLEVSVVTKIQALGCQLVMVFVQRLDHQLLPHLTQIMAVLSVHLEQRNTTEYHHVLLHTLKVILQRYHSSHSSIVAARLMKAVLPSISVVLATPESVSGATASDPAPLKVKKSKKARSYEGDELFAASRPIICPTDTDGKVLFTALEVVQLLLQDPHLPDVIQSISIRVLISTLLLITQLLPANLSPDPALYYNVLTKLQGISTEFTSGSSNTLSKSLPLVADAIIRGGGNIECQRQLELLLHPRLPPLMRSMPLADHLSLVFSEESDEETRLRKSLGLYTGQDEVRPDVDTMSGGRATPPAPVLPAASPSKPPPTNQPPTRTIPTASPKPTDVRSVQTLQVFPAAKPTLVEPMDISHPTLIQPVKPSNLQTAAKETGVEPPSIAPTWAFYPSVENDEDEEMPAINMDSDSDIE